jgi:hypothetical protein
MKSENKLMVMGWLSKWSDTDLAELRHLICEETCNRERKRREARQNWVYRYAQEAYHRGNFEVVNNNTVVVAVCQNDHIVMGKATPINGDKFDLDTGVAVAYAKAVGLCIPDFI